MIALLTISVNLIGDAVARTQASAPTVGATAMSARPEAMPILASTGCGSSAATACRSSRTSRSLLAPGEILGHRRRVGLGQDDDGARPARLHARRRADRRRAAHDRRQRDAGRDEADARARAGGRLVRAAEPGLGAESRAARRRRGGRRAEGARAGRRARRERARRARTCRAPGRPPSRAATRTSSPAASSSASRSRSALVCEPAAVVLDEPTTGLDVVTQARILEEIARLRDESRSRRRLRHATTSRWSRRSPTASP